MAMQFSEEDQEKLKNSKSELYKKRTKETNDEDIKNLSKIGKIRHFMQYYFKTLLIIVVIAAVFLAWIVQAMLDRDINVLYVAIEKDVFDEEEIADFQQILEEYFQTSDRETVVVDVDCSHSQLQTYLYTGTVDVVISEEESYKHWAKSAYFMDTTDYSEVSFYNNYDEEYRLYSQYVSGEDVRNNTTDQIGETEASDQTEYYCGIYLTDSDKYKELGGFVEKPVIGISVNSANTEYAQQFIEYMLDNSIPLE
ncbi:MAG: hypothetical protein LUH14_12320 [Clostridiaceae bacterium]|nr:hypothetical protein [Clostridiaceae bacterium]